MRKLAAGAVLCLAIAGCGSSSTKHPAQTTTAGNPVASTGTPTTVARLPANFNQGYAQAWGQMKQVAAEVTAAINQVKRAHARHQTVPNSQLAAEFAIFASRFTPAVIELQGLTPPPSVTSAYKSMSAGAAGMAGTLRNFSTDANADNVAQAQQDLAAYFAYAVTIDRAATKIYNKLGIK
ncbi:MAG TPA: hypothetical protein VG294_20110 [Solirubrobacteraceae bacterium]|nr:hypothetical protein [Solirubrobacteraceae bacterium]